MILTLKHAQALQLHYACMNVCRYVCMYTCKKSHASWHIHTEEKKKKKQDSHTQHAQAVPLVLVEIALVCHPALKHVDSDTLLHAIHHGAPIHWNPRVSQNTLPMCLAWSSRDHNESGWFDDNHVFLTLHARGWRTSCLRGVVGQAKKIVSRALEIKKNKEFIALP